MLIFWFDISSNPKLLVTFLIKQQQTCLLLLQKQVCLLGSSGKTRTYNPSVNSRMLGQSLPIICTTVICPACAELLQLIRLFPTTESPIQMRCFTVENFDLDPFREMGENELDLPASKITSTFPHLRLLAQLVVYFVLGFTINLEQHPWSVGSVGSTRW